MTLSNYTSVFYNSTIRSKGMLKYMGTWDASSGVYPQDPETGYFWIISTAGTIDGQEYQVHDWMVYNGSGWERIDARDDVVSVNNKTGVVVLEASDIPYDGSVSELPSDDVQGAIDALNAKLDSRIGLTPKPTSPPSDKIEISEGRYRNSDGTKIIIFPGGVSPMILPVITLPRIDIICLDDYGNISVIQGAESNSPQAPSYPLDKLTVAEVYVDEINNVVVTEEDIKDARDVLGPSPIKIIDGGTFV